MFVDVCYSETEKTRGRNKIEGVCCVLGGVLVAGLACDLTLE